MDRVGEIIRQIRKENKLTQDDLTGPNVSRGMISLIERNLTTPSLRTLGSIANKLGVSVGTLLGEESSSNTLVFNPISKEEVAKVIKICDTLLIAEKFSEAKEKLERLLSNDNLELYQRGIVYRLLGAIFIEFKEYDKALLNLNESLLYIAPSETEVLIEVYFQISTAYMEIKEFQMGIESALYSKVIMKSKHFRQNELIYFKIQYNLAYCLCRISEYDKGLDIINESISRMDKKNTYYNLGSFLMLKGLAELYLKKFEDAITSTNKSLKFLDIKKETFRYIGAKTNIGILYRKIKSYEISAMYLIESIELAHKFEDINLIVNGLYELGETYTKSKKWAEAEEAINKGISQAPNDSLLLGKLLLSLAEIRYNLKAYNQALEVLQKAKKIFNNKEAIWQAKVLFIEASIYESLDQTTEAYFRSKQANSLLLEDI